jgi:NAD(P)-dependent dehydrogenase (short-subunit alcohol dehydrogenase family)
MNIIVNGGTRGIGKEVVNCFSRDLSNRIIVTGRTKEALDKLSEEHKNVTGIRADMSVFDSQAEDFIREVKTLFGHVDILINIAGYLKAEKFMETSNIEARLAMETNFFGPATVIRLLKPIMPSGSHILNISSMGGFQGSMKFPGLSYYSASKAAIACLTECLANEFKDSGISVNCLALGSVQTEMLNEAFPGYAAPVKAHQMAEFISDFSLNGNKYFNGKILPVAMSNP